MRAYVLRLLGRRCKHWNVSAVLHESTGQSDSVHTNSAEFKFECSMLHQTFPCAGDAVHPVLREVGLGYSETKSVHDMEQLRLGKRGSCIQKKSPATSFFDFMYYRALETLVFSFFSIETLVAALVQVFRQPSSSLT